MIFPEKMVYCPLSGSSHTVLLENIKTDELKTLYNHQLSINVAADLDGTKTIGFYYCPDSDLKFFYPSIAGSENFYDQLQKIDWYYLQEKFEYDYAQHFITQSDRVLEIGCGSGLFAQNLAVKEYCGLEFSHMAQEIAQNRGLKVLCEPVQSHAQYHQHYYDVVCAFQVLEHISTIDQFIESCLHCLKPGGLLIYSVPSADSFLSIAKNNLLNMPPHHISWWSDKALKFISEKFKLEMVAIDHEPLSELHKVPYLSTLLLEGINQRFNLEFSLLNQSWLYRILAKSSELIAQYWGKSLSASNLFANGHSVVAVYRKEQT